MKKFLAFYIVLFVAGTFAIDKYFPAFASDAPPAAPENEAPVVVAGEANPPAAEPVKQAEPAPAPAFDTRRLPPLPENLQSSGNFKSWGLAKTNLSPEIPGGTFLEYPDKDATPLLAWWFANKKWNGPLEVPPEKVTFFGGSLDDAEPGQLGDVAGIRARAARDHYGPHRSVPVTCGYSRMYASAIVECGRPRLGPALRRS